MGVVLMDKAEGGQKPPTKKCLTVEVENLDPFAAVALFKYAQNVCKRQGLTELVEVGCNITATFAGGEGVNVEEAKAMLSKWQDAHVTETEVTR
jgi:hypothetical protein